MKFTSRSAVLPAAVIALSVVSTSGADAQSSNHNRTPPAATQPQEPATGAQTSEAAGAGLDAAGQPVRADQEQNVGAAPVDPAATADPNSQAAAPQEGNALGVTDGWDARFNTEPPQSSQFTGAEDQLEVVAKVNDYFNNMKNLEGRFIQTDANNDRQKGKFFLERPGKVLFRYSPPSRMRIISDGEYLAIENHDLRTSDRYPLESTPFKLLLADQVDLARDARIIALDAGENIIVLTVEDKDNNSGQIRLFFDWPEIQLREWIITDAQGLNTRIQLAELEIDKEADKRLFTFSKDIGLPDFRNDSR